MSDRGVLTEPPITFMLIIGGGFKPPFGEGRGFLQELASPFLFILLFSPVFSRVHFLFM